MRSNLLALILLIAASGPEWLFTTDGCKHLAPEGIEQFNAQMSTDLHGCVMTHHELADIYKCSDGGAYMIFWKENECNVAVRHFRAHHLELAHPEGPSI
jgi:hypothetical protein